MHEHSNCTYSTVWLNHENNCAFRCIYTDRTKPTAKKQETIEDPPELKNGSDIPVIGNNIRAAPMLINI